MSLAGRIAWDDTILPFQLDRADIRGRVGRLDSVLETILGQHDYPAPVAALVAEAALITALIGQTIKLRWKLSLQIRGDGPVRLIATDYFGPGRGGPARADARLGRLRRRGAARRGGAAVRPARQGRLRDPDRPGAGDHALPGRHADRRRLARRLRRDLFRPVRAAADPLRAGDGRGGRARRRGALARRRGAAAAHAEGLALRQAGGDRLRRPARRRGHARRRRRRQLAPGGDAARDRRGDRAGRPARRRRAAAAAALQRGGPAGLRRAAGALRLHLRPGEGGALAGDLSGERDRRR